MSPTTTGSLTPCTPDLNPPTFAADRVDSSTLRVTILPAAASLVSGGGYIATGATVSWKNYTAQGGGGGTLARTFGFQFNIIAGPQGAIAFQAANKFVGTETCGLNGATGDEACMAAVNQILINAGLSPLGAGPTGSNYIPSAVPPAIASGRLVAIPQSGTIPGDLTVRHSPGDTYTSVVGDEHIGVCEASGCTTVLSNSSSKSTGDPNCPLGVFGWSSPPTMDNYAGSPYIGGYSDFYRVMN